MAILTAMNNVLATAARAIVVILIVVVTLLLTAQVFLRYVVGISLSWSEELSLGMFCWATLLMAAVGVRDGFHVRMALLLRSTSSKLRVRFERVIHLITILVGVYLTVSAWRYFDGTRGGTSAAISYPIEYLHASAIFCGVLIVLFALEALLEGRVPIDEAEELDV